MDLGKSPKEFCEQVIGGFTNEFFVMGVRSGEATDVYVLTLEHAKRMSQWLAHAVETYEKQYGKINAEWNPNMKSPIQSSDLPGDGKKKS
jgi:hypothetical protein